MNRLILSVEVRVALDKNGSLVYDLIVGENGKSDTYRFDDEREARTYANRFLNVPRDE